MFQLFGNGDFKSCLVFLRIAAGSLYNTAGIFVLPFNLSLRELSVMYGFHYREEV